MRDIYQELREAKHASRPLIQRAVFETAHGGRALRGAMLRDLAALAGMLEPAGQELMVKNSVYTLATIKTDGVNNGGAA
jgi:hypothetical protein